MQQEYRTAISKVEGTINSIEIRWVKCRSHDAGKFTLDVIESPGSSEKPFIARSGAKGLANKQSSPGTVALNDEVRHGRDVCTRRTLIVGMCQQIAGSIGPTDSNDEGRSLRQMT